jgi:hypothetical protein
LRGDDADAVAIAASGFTGSVLTNIGLIDGLQGFLDGMIATLAGDLVRSRQHYPRRLAAATSSKAVAATT